MSPDEVMAYLTQMSAYLTQMSAHLTQLTTDLKTVAHKVDNLGDAVVEMARAAEWVIVLDEPLRSMNCWQYALKVPVHRLPMEFSFQPTLLAYKQCMHDSIEANGLKGLCPANDPEFLAKVKQIQAKVGLAGLEIICSMVSQQGGQCCAHFAKLRFLPRGSSLGSCTIRSDLGRPSNCDLNHPANAGMACFMAHKHGVGSAVRLCPLKQSVSCMAGAELMTYRVEHWYYFTPRMVTPAAYLWTAANAREAVALAAATGVGAVVTDGATYAERVNDLNFHNVLSGAAGPPTVTITFPAPAEVVE